MNRVIFDGRKFADGILNQVQVRIRGFTEKVSRKPKLVSLLDPSNGSSVLYTRIKSRAAARVGIEFEKIEASQLTIDNCKLQIEAWNSDKNIDGIMVQLPINFLSKDETRELVYMIDPSKDVDGLREDSKFVPATVRAVMAILEEAGRVTGCNLVRGVVVGVEGWVGKRLKIELDRSGIGMVGMDKLDFDVDKIKAADLVISCTGQPGLIKENMVKDGVVVIDVGSPEGDFDPLAAGKASFVTPVPGGVGPVTVAMLMKNLCDTLRYG